MSEGEIIENGGLSRYDLSFYSFRQLQRDHIRFEQEYVDKFPNKFVCRILTNYMCHAQENDLDGFEKAVSDVLRRKQHNEYYYNSRICFTVPLTNKMQEFDFASSCDFKKRTVITYILHRFTALPVWEREKIYFIFQYKAIISAIEKKELLLVKNITGKEYEVKPYRIVVDENSFSYYLMGYSRFKGEDGDFEFHSFNLSRISECRSKHREFLLTCREENEAKEIYEKFGPAYAISKPSDGKIEKTVVRLTEKGYKSLFLMIIARQRPIPISKPIAVNIGGKRYYVLEFDCSHRQIHNYFFSYGAEAEIISPEWLRSSFCSGYQRAWEQYWMEQS